MAGVFIMKLTSAECYWKLMMMRQHWFIWLQTMPPYGVTRPQQVKNWEDLTHKGLGKMDAILQRTFSASFFFHEWNVFYFIQISLNFVPDVPIDPSYNASVPYPTIHHSEQKYVHFCSEWCIVRYGTGALWDLWIWSIDNRSTSIEVMASEWIRG